MHPALVGCGKMGGALLRGWLELETVTAVSILEPGALPPDVSDHPRIIHHRDITALQNDKNPVDIIILAVKPQIMDDICKDLPEIVTPALPILSIAAGRTIESFEQHFGQDQPVIRAMPNTPAAIGKGITVAAKNPHVTPSQTETAQTLLSTAGPVEWVTDESLFNAVTALSGSGPAYVFLLIETLAKAGEKQGLDADLAMTLARRTVIGAAALAEADPDSPAATLRENVTSPGGTTQAALNVLMTGELQDLFDRALAAATQRGEELG